MNLDFDNITGQKIQSRLKSKYFELVKNGKANNENWENGVSLVGNKDKNDIHDIFYGRKTIREETLKFELYTNKIRSLLEEPMKQHRIAAAADLWTDDLMKRTYLDFTIFLVNDIDELKHTLLRCKHFDATKTGINIWHEIEQIFQSFNLSFADNIITIDQGSNTIKALSLDDETRYPCLAHRTNTVLETTWENGKNMNVEFKNFCSSVSNLRTYCQQCGGIQFKLPKTLKRTSGTRPWRSYFLILDSLHQSYESLMVLLRERDEQHRLLQIDPQLLYEI
ncbi:unnamed protein product, partial [Rotaria sp. Silwood2]